MAEPEIVLKETDARFWSQTGYKPGQKLDPQDSQDAKMIPVWNDIFAKVKREYAAGKLVTTFDHPVVTQNLVEAHAADQAAATHLDAAKKAPDAAVAQQHVDAAAVAVDVSAQKTREAAAVQPPTASPQLTDDASKAAALQPPPPTAPAKDHVANAQAQKAHRPAPRGLLAKETDARFWAQTHYKPGQKLDPSDPSDARMIPVWNDIFQKVSAEDARGALVITYNHPVVAQNLADAQVADQVTAVHLDAAAGSPDPAAMQQNVGAAANAADVSAQKTREAAQLQPPTVDPQLAHGAGDDRALLVRETYVRFWAATHYKPGKRLDRRDPQDAQMIPVWASFFEQVQREHAVGVPPAGRDQLAQEQARWAGRRAEEVHRHHRRNRHKMRSAVHPKSVQDYRAGAAQLAHQANAPYVLVVLGPDGKPDQRTFGSRAELDAEYAKLSDQHDQYRYVAAFDLAASPGVPVHDSVGVPAAEHADVPPPGPPGPPGPDAAPSVPTPDAGAPTQPSDLTPPPEEKKGWSVGKILAIAAGVAAAGGLVYAASQKVKGVTSPRARGRGRAPKVFVASPAAPASVSAASPLVPSRGLRA